MTTATPRVVTLSEFRDSCRRLRARWDAHDRRWRQVHFKGRERWGEAYLRRVRWMRWLLILPDDHEPPTSYDPRGTCGCGEKALDGKLTCGLVGHRPPYEPPRRQTLGNVRDLLQRVCTTPHNDDGHGHEN